MNIIYMYVDVEGLCCVLRTREKCSPNHNIMYVAIAQMIFMYFDHHCKENKLTYVHTLNSVVYAAKKIIRFSNSQPNLYLCTLLFTLCHLNTLARQIANEPAVPAYILYSA